MQIPEQLTKYPELRYLKLVQGQKFPVSEETGWTENESLTYSSDDLELQTHLNEGGNYGVICGPARLRVIDVDDIQITPEFEKFLLTLGASTFVVETGKGGKHYYFFSDYTKTRNYTGVGEFKSDKVFVVGPNSTHPNGNPYKTVNSVPIVELTKEQTIKIQEWLEDKKRLKISEKICNVSIKHSQSVINTDDELIKKILPYWDEGDRQNLALSLAGYLRKVGYGLKGAKDTITELCDLTNDEEKQSRIRIVEETYNKNENEIKGYTGLEEILPEAVLKDIIGLSQDKYKDDSNNDSLKVEVLALLASGKRDEATEALVVAIRTKEHIYTTRDDENAEVWIYNKGIYIPQGKTFIREFVREIFGEAYTTALSKLVIAKIEADTYVDSKMFFTNNIIEEVAVENGLLNIFTKELKEFTPNKIFFNKLPVKYESEKDCPMIKKHLKTVLKNEEDILVMQELFGYFLLKDYKIEKAVMFSGSGRNGKSKTLELMKRFLGAENCSSISPQMMEKDQYAISELFGKMANLSGDINSTALTQTGRFKEATGRDLITAQRKYKPLLFFINYAKMIFSANELPRTRDITPAFWNRWVYLEFPYMFKTQAEIDALPEEEKKNIKLIDPDIIQKLTTSAELSGLLNWALEGLKRLLEQKNFSHTKTAEEVEKIWLRKSSSFSAFLMDTVEEKYGSKISKSELRRAYSLYCREYKLSVKSDKVIKDTLITTFNVGEEREKVLDKQIHLWEDIKFKEGKGSEDSRGFSTYKEKIKSPISQKNITTQTKEEEQKKELDRYCKESFGTKKRE